MHWGARAALIESRLLVPHPSDVDFDKILYIHYNACQDEQALRHWETYTRGCNRTCPEHFDCAQCELRRRMVCTAVRIAPVQESGWQILPRVGRDAWIGRGLSMPGTFRREGIIPSRFVCQDGNAKGNDHLRVFVCLNDQLINQAIRDG
jgi:hypothetical protein